VGGEFGRGDKEDGEGEGGLRVMKERWEGGVTVGVLIGIGVWIGP
jgi:hypothetical protein